MDEEYDEPVVAASTSARRETHENECKFPAHELLISNLVRVPLSDAAHSTP